ncbi:phosphatase PAP2 family protein [Candidatus Woesearchaeota archaeon]|nr:phosphatase PAP2 family protein [Candidatus Woesearchaeota archaeon]
MRSVMPKNIFQKWLDEGMRDATTLGSIFFSMLLVVLFYLVGYSALANSILLGIILIHIIVIAVRSVYFKKRPEALSYTTWLEKIEANSFPSVHTARIFVLVTLLTHPYTDYMMTIILFLFAVCIAYTRIYLKKHYWSDVFAGAVLGVILGGVLASFFL